MSFASWPRMLMSETEGWSDVVRMHPSVKKLLLAFVVPMSLIPAVMYAYSELMHPGAVFPLLAPPLSLREATVVGVVFFAVEIAMVLLMAIFVQEAGEAVNVRVNYESAFTLAAIAPAPLWLAALALFIPSLWANMLIVAIAWIGSAALIRHGVRPLLGVRDPVIARRIANVVTFVGVLAWVGLIIVLGLLLSIVFGFR